MKNKYPDRTKQKARELRHNGWSLGEIAQELKLPKNTLSGWTKGINLTEKQKERIRKKIAASGIIGRRSALKANLTKLNKWKKNIQEKVKHYKDIVVEKEEFGKIICGILYLCEGSKYPASQVMTFGNSNPEIIKFFLFLLKKYFCINEKKLHCRVMPRWDQNIKRLQSFWSKITGIPISKFYRTKPDLRSKGKKTLKKDYKGVCAIEYCNTSLQFELQSIGETVIKATE